jgi:hypothetical protein
LFFFSSFRSEEKENVCIWQSTWYSICDENCLISFQDSTLYCQIVKPKSRPNLALRKPISSQQTKQTRHYHEKMIISYENKLILMNFKFAKYIFANSFPCRRTKREMENWRGSRRDRRLVHHCTGRKLP